jgi:hypothetical protein
MRPQCRHYSRTSSFANLTSQRHSAAENYLSQIIFKKLNLICGREFEFLRILIGICEQIF